MALLKIVKYGDNILRQKVKDVEEITPEIKQLANDMLETMYAAPGVGLAAPQVGISLNMCVIDVLPDGKKKPFVLINPKIISGQNKEEMEEGCLSFTKKLNDFIPSKQNILTLTEKELKLLLRAFWQKLFSTKQII